MIAVLQKSTRINGKIIWFPKEPSRRLSLLIPILDNISNYPTVFISKFVRAGE